MAAPRQDAHHSPDLEATDARQARLTPGSFSMLAISTIMGLIVVAIIWAVFAGPLQRAPSKPQVQSTEQANTYSQPRPQAKLHPSPSNTGAPGGSPVNQP